MLDMWVNHQNFTISVVTVGRILLLEFVFLRAGGKH